MDPEVSVIIPTKGREPFLGDLVSSILDQSSVLEILLVDALPYANADVGELYFPFNLRYIRQDSGRKGSALNLGVRFARSEKLLFLDADVALQPGQVSEALALLDAVDIVSASRRHEIMGWNVIAEPFVRWIGFPGPWFCMMTKDTFGALKGWDDHIVEDVTMHIRVHELGLQVGYIPTKVRLRRRVRSEWRKAYHLWREVIRS